MKTSSLPFICSIVALVAMGSARGDLATYHTFGTSNTVTRINEDGEAHLNFPLPFIASFTQPSGLAVDSEAKELYYARLSFVGKTNLDGSGNTTVKDLGTGNGPSHLELDEDGEHLYFYVHGSTQGTMERGIYRMNTDGTVVTPVITGTLLAAIKPPISPLITSTAEDGMVIDPESGHLYWSDARRLFRSSLAGADPVVVGTFPFNIRSFEIDTANDKLYYSDNTHIERSELDGSTATTIYSPGFGFPEALELDSANDRLYFIQDRKLKYTNLDGSLSPVEVRGIADTGASDIEVGPLPDLTMPRIVGVEKLSTSGGLRLRISHTTDPGINYTIQSSTTMKSGSWTATGASVTGDGTVRSTEFAISGIEKFFRVVCEDPCD